MATTNPPVTFIAIMIIYQLKPFVVIIINLSTLMKIILISVAILLVLSVAQKCDFSQDLRTDCGYMGINQQQC